MFEATISDLESGDTNGDKIVEMGKKRENHPSR